jgi:hypothetical protein
LNYNLIEKFGLMHVRNYVKKFRRIFFIINCKVLNNDRKDSSKLMEVQIT